jgi:ribosomal protein L33
MPRGKRKVFGLYCAECNQRIASIRFHGQNSKGVTAKDQIKKLHKFCSSCRKIVDVKGKEEKHSSN